MPACVQIQVCSNPVVTGHTHYALSVAKNVIMFYEREFGIPYPLPKQGQFLGCTYTKARF